MVKVKRRREADLNISDLIAEYLKTTIERSGKNLLEIKRSEIAKKFQCVPSQINYVIRTRFTLENGYLVESKRGGGGYIRIIKISLDDHVDLFDQMIDIIGEHVDQNTAENIIVRLLDEEAITKREAKLMLSAANRAMYPINVTQRDKIRANILKAMLKSLKYKK